MSIYVVGAGPGNPKLLTVWAVEVLREVDVVAHGDLVPEEVVELYAPNAKRVKIGSKRSEHDAAVEALIEEAKSGKKVAILKNGDPTLFGRGMQICRKAKAAGVPCYIIPGVSAFTAAAALHEVELTNGVDLRHVALLAYPHVDADTVKSIAADTLVIYMMGSHFAQLGEVLRDCVEIYLCHAVSMGGGCIPTKPSQLWEYTNLRPAIVIARCGKKED